MLNAYPRPNFERAAWTNLNGAWQFAFDDGDAGLAQGWHAAFPEGREIQVPYTYETRMSGIGEERFHPVVWYHRVFTVGKPVDGRLLLHFEGVDHDALVYVNGAFAASHSGGYAAFSADITPFAKEGENTLTLRVADSDSCAYPRGKQRWKKENFGCWYVQTTGIWKTVWLEEVPRCHLSKVDITPDVDAAAFHFEALVSGLEPGEEAELACEIRFEGALVHAQTLRATASHVAFAACLGAQDQPWGLKLWHPDHPHLYEVSFTLRQGGQTDCVRSYAGLRKVEVRGGTVLLNGLPLYQRLILDQGYWPDSHLTPPDDEAYARDLELVLKAGYNGLRKHQKTEDRRFLHLCDRMGVLVWSEMAAAYRYDGQARALFLAEWQEVVAQNRNHPSVIAWTPFNESWGLDGLVRDASCQAFVGAVYALTRAMDPTRPVIANDGWEHTVSDLVTLHDYEEDGARFAARYADLPALLNNSAPFNGFKYAFAQGHAYAGQPIILSEYGGIALRDERGWGYGNQVADGEAFLKRFEAITTAIQQHPLISGYCYTQLSDVQQEVNGLVTPERVPKVDLEAVREINLRRR